MRGRSCAWAGLVLVLPSASCGGSDDAGGGGQGLGTAGCLTDDQICQFQEGVSTQDDVRNALGNAQTYLGNSTAIYVCQQIVGQQIVHNDQVIFDFDSSGHLSDVMVLRQGTGATPAPDCRSSNTGASGAGTCSNVPRPAPDSTTCQGIAFGGPIVSTTCTDQAGHKWTESCQGTSCNCSYDDAPACTCPVTSGSRGCCPGMPGAP